MSWKFSCLCMTSRNLRPILHPHCHAMTTMEESLSSSSSEEVETIPHLLQTLQNSNNKDEIVEAIEELRAISRGDGNF